MKLFLATGVAVSLFALVSAQIGVVNPQTPQCFALGPFAIEGNGIPFLGGSFSGTLQVGNPSPGTDVELFISCTGCVQICDCKIATKLSVGFGQFLGLAFTYGEIDLSQQENTLIIAGGGDDLEGGYGTFKIVDFGLNQPQIQFEAKLNPCIFGGVNPFLPSVNVGALVVGTVKMEITCGLNTCIADTTSAFCSIQCTPGEKLGFKCTAIGSPGVTIDTFTVFEKIEYGSEVCLGNGLECKYLTIVFNFDTTAFCAAN